MSLTERPERVKHSPPDANYVYTPVLPRYGGAALDVIFLHIILIPLRMPAADWSFRTGSIWPAAAFVVFYFTLLTLLLCLRGWTPGGIPLGYRIVNAEMKFPPITQALKRLAPYIVIQTVGLWRLHIALQGFAATGEAYELDQLGSLIKEHGGVVLNYLVVALNFFVVADMAPILNHPRNQSLTDIIAGTFAVTKSS